MSQLSGFELIMFQNLVQDQWQAYESHHWHRFFMNVNHWYSKYIPLIIYSYLLSASVGSFQLRFDSPVKQCAWDLLYILKVEAFVPAHSAAVSATIRNDTINPLKTQMKLWNLPPEEQHHLHIGICETSFFGNLSLACFWRFHWNSTEVSGKLEPSDLGSQLEVSILDLPFIDQRCVSKWFYGATKWQLPQQMWRTAAHTMKMAVFTSPCFFFWGSTAHLNQHYHKPFSVVLTNQPVW